MNRSDFISIIENTTPIDRHAMGEFYELINIFPYFQSAHLLLLKGLQASSDVKFENQLRNSSIHIADREVLYYLLKTKPQSLCEQVGKEKDVESPDNQSSYSQQVVIESARNSDDLIDEIERDSEETALRTIDDDNSKPTELEETDSVIFLLDEEASSVDENVFYMDPGFSISDHSDLLELDISEDDIIKSESGVGDQKESENRDIKSNKHVQSDLIDKFIITNPRIEPNRDKSSMLSKDNTYESVEEDGGFVTEILAGIYVNQGYYSKAIDIYEKLSLKFPEKNSYFASQIGKVKEFIKK
jgi:hypothetical protein